MAAEGFDIQPWSLRESSLDPDQLSRTESLFALSNGHIGVRGTLDEGEPVGLPGTYLNGVYETHPLPYAEEGYSDPESGQSIVNVTDGKLMRLLVDDEPLDLRYGTVRSHERELDFRAGVLRRDIDWTTPVRQRVLIRSQRLVSLTQRSILAVRYEVEPLEDEALVVLQSGLVVNEDLPSTGGHDPRVARALARPLVAEEQVTDGARALLMHRVRTSGIRVGAAMDHRVEAPDGVDVDVHSEASGDWARVTFTARLQPGQRLIVTKLVAYGWSARRSIPAVRDQVAAALSAARATGWDRLLAEQRAYLDEFWARADVEVGGDPALQQAIRFALFHVVQAAARAELRPIPSKGLTGSGYDGHCFWDTESFVLPVLSHTMPELAADALRWRHSTLEPARQRAHQLGLAGASFPWRTIDGAECSGYWPAGTAAMHINADIADALVRHIGATGDVALEREIGVDLLVHTARLWRSLGHHTIDGAFHIDGVTGPDEYSAVVDDNVFTNLMAAHNMVAAADVAVRHPDLARALDVDEEEVASWRDAATAISIPFDEELGIHSQDRDFTQHAPWDFGATSAEDYPLLMHRPYFQLYRSQVCKQADLVLAMQLRGSSFTAEQKRRNFDYYDAITVRDSSLSSCTQAVLAAEVGYLDLAYSYASEAAFMDLHDLHGNTRDGLHVASLAGVWTALVAGFGGMRDEGGKLSFCPRLPAGLDRLTFRLFRGGRILEVDVFTDHVCYRLVRETDEPLTIWHEDRRVQLTGTEALECELIPVKPLLAPHRPPGQPLITAAQIGGAIHPSR